MLNFVQDLRYAFRTLVKNPGFTTVAVLTLALGIGANVATYSVVYGVLLKPLPFPQPEQLVRVFDDQNAGSEKDIGMSVPELWDLQDRSGVFTEISAVGSSNSAVAGGDRIVRAESLVTSPDYFTLLGARPELGRIYTQQDAAPGFLEPVVISNGFWRRYYGSDPNIVGRKMRLDGDMYTIVGVMPAGFRHPGPTLDTDVEVWLATGFNGQPFPSPPNRSQRFIGGAIARLKPGLTVAKAQAQLNSYVAQLTRTYPQEYPAAAGWALRLVPIKDDLVGPQRTELFILLGAVGFVLLIACVNIANLLLARSSSRRREIAIRLTMGAGRAPIDSPTAHRKHAARSHFRRRRARHRALPEKRNRQPRTRRHSAVERSRCQPSCTSFRIRNLARHRRPLRPCTCPAICPRRSNRKSARRWPGIQSRS